MSNIFSTLYVRWLCLMGKAIDVLSSSKYPADVLSNLANNAFVIDGVKCESMEDFLQSGYDSHRSRVLLHVDADKGKWQR